MRQAYDYWQDQPGSYRANVAKSNVRHKAPFARETKLPLPGNDFGKFCAASKPKAAYQRTARKPESRRRCESREKFPRKYSLPPIATAAGELKGWFLTQGATPAALPKRRPGSRYQVRPSQDAVRLVETLDMTDTKLLRTHCLCRRFHVGLLAGNSKISRPGSHSFVSNKWGEVCRKPRSTSTAQNRVRR